MNSTEAVQTILGKIGPESVKVSLHKDGDFDIFIKVNQNVAFYAFQYALDGWGIGIRQHQKETSSFWNLEHFGIPEGEAKREDLVRIFLEVYRGGRYFKVLNGKAVTKFVFDDPSFADLSIYEIIETCQEFR